jgi:hypothetical protein
MNVRAAFLLLFCGLAACETPPAAPTPVSLPRTPPAGEPGNVMGMDASRIRVAFGAPQFVRKDGQVEMWRYDGATCKAFFFMYPNGNSLAVRHVETQPRPSNAAADSNCLQALIARAKTAAS